VQLSFAAIVPRRLLAATLASKRLDNATSTILLTLHARWPIAAASADLPPERALP
jgi:hypothetical protein